MSLKALKLGLLAFLVAAGFAVPAQAGVITYGASGPSGDGPLKGSATFTTSAGEIEITLTDTLAASLFKSQGQALSGITFTLSNAPGAQGTPAPSATGQLGDIASGKTGMGQVTYVAGEPTNWVGTGGQGTFSVSGDTFTLGATGGSQPSDMIAPYLADGQSYNGVTGGIDNFNPYSIGTVNIVLIFMGITSATTVTAANFAFGTGPDYHIPGIKVPEPLTLSLFGAGLVGAAGLRRRKKA